MTIRYRVWAGNDPQGRRKPDVWRTEEELRKRWDWRMLHPEIKRRLLALFVLSDHRIGFLSGARSAAEQAKLYIERGGVGVAPAGLSWHEDDSYEGYALAADLIEDATRPGNDLDLIDHLGPLVGLHDFSHVNREDWHVQPNELPNSRSAYKRAPTRYRLTTWTLPGTPTPPPTIPDLSGDLDMNRPLLLSSTQLGAQFLYVPGGTCVSFASQDEASAILGALRVSPDDAGFTIVDFDFSADQIARLTQAA